MLERKSSTQQFSHQPFFFFFYFLDETQESVDVQDANCKLQIHISLIQTVKKKNVNKKESKFKMVFWSIFLLPLFVVSEPTKQPRHSLNSPFELVLPSWTYGGSTEVFPDFVRLTPDRQSRKGLYFPEFFLSFFMLKFLPTLFIFYFNFKYHVFLFTEK